MLQQSDQFVRKQTREIYASEEEAKEMKIIKYT